MKKSHQTVFSPEEKDRVIIREFFRIKKCPNGYGDSNDCSIDDEIGEEDYVVVNVTRKARVMRYIVRIDQVNDGEYEGVEYCKRLTMHLANCRQ